MTDITKDPFLNPRRERLVEADGQNMYVPKAGFFDSDNWSAGFGEGQKYTSYGLLQDLGMKLNPDPSDTIDVDDWNESHPYYFEDINWDQSLTLDVARNIFFTRKQSENYANLQARSTTGGMFARGMSIFGAAAFDPINIVAAPAAIYAKAGLAGKMLWAGGANLLVEGMLQGVAYGTQDVRGQKLETSDVAINLAAAMGIGAAFPVAGRALSKLFTGKKATEVPGDRTSQTEVDYTPQQKQSINSKSGHNKQTKTITINNTDFTTISSIKINAKGRVVTDGEGATVTKSDDGIISITGKANDVIKILPTLTARLDGFENINLKIDGSDPVVFTNASELKNSIKGLEKQHNVKANLDNADTILNEVKFKDKSYQIEFDENGNITGNVFEVTPTGKLRKKPMPENKAQEIIRANQEQIKNKRTEINKKVGAPELNENVNVGNENVNTKLRTKKNYSTQTQTEASVSGQKREFIENHGNTETSYKALIGSQTIKAKDWFSAGYFINRAGERIDLTVTRVADLEASERALLAKRLDIRRTEIPVNEEGFVVPTGRGLELRKRLDDFDAESRSLDNEKNVLRDYLDCRRVNG